MGVDKHNLVEDVSIQESKSDTLYSIHLILVSNSGEMHELWLPATPEGSFFLTESPEHRFLSISSKNGIWVASCKKPAFFQDVPLEHSCEIPLTDDQSLKIDVEGRTYSLYVEKVFRNQMAFHSHLVGTDIEINADEQIQFCEKRIEELEQRKETQLQTKSRRLPNAMPVLIIIAAFMLVSCIATLLLSNTKDNEATLCMTYWSGTGDAQYDCQNNIATLSFPTWDSFPESEITIANAYNDIISLDNFVFEWENGTVHIAPNDSLPFGVYHIRFVCHDGDASCSLCYGYEGEIYQAFSVGVGWYDYQFQNWKNERYLVQTDSGLETTASYADRTTFAWWGEMCGIEVGSNGYAYPNNKGGMVEFTTYAYELHEGKSLLAFTYDGWYMASDSEGLVYFTKTLNDECYWVFEK